MPLYFCSELDFKSVEALAQKYFEQAEGSPSVWLTPERIGDCRRNFHIAPNVVIEIPGADRYKSFTRAYGDAIEDMVAAEGYADSSFLRFVRELGKFDVYDCILKQFRPDIAELVIKGREQKPAKPAQNQHPEPARHSSVGVYVDIHADFGLIQEHDEDGKPVGTPYNPFAAGSEDMIPEEAKAAALSIQPPQASPLRAVEFDEDGHACRWGDNSVARACGVDLSGFNDRMDGL